MNEYRGDVKRTVTGDTWSEKVETTHWFENITKKPAVILAFDLVAAKK